MRMIKAILLLIIILTALTSCMTGRPAPIVGTPRTRSPGVPLQGSLVDNAYYMKADNSPQSFPVLFRGRTSRRGMYEPAEGVYLGAWLCAETSLRMFEYQAGRRHAVYVHEMQLSDEVPVTWLLHCIAAQATPLIIIHPDEVPCDEIPPSEMVIYLAQRLGSFNLPMFIVFFPEHDLMPAEYVIIFRYARSVFMAHAPLTAFVWSAPNASATPQNPFYPGHDAVDWVALELLAGRNSDGKKADIISELEDFYHAFQAHKPIMLLPLGISHFSRGDYTYRINETASDIRNIYNALRNFPRIGLIVYADAFTLSPDLWDDFSISAEPILTEAYREAISHEYFLSALETNARDATRFIRSAHHGYYWEGRIYVSTRTLETELNTTPPRQSTEINQQAFAESRHLSSLNISACPDRRVILIDGILD